MDQSASPPLQQQAARALAHYRNELRLDLWRMNSRRVIPQPLYPLETFAEESDEAMGSVSDPAVTSDTDTMTVNSENDVSMGEGDTSPEDVDMPVEDLNHAEHLPLIGATVGRMEVSEDVQMEGNDSDEDMDTYLYPDPKFSEMIPPPTPRLHHLDLPLPFIDDSETSGVANKTPGAQMDDCEEGDLSNINHLTHAHYELPFPSSKMHSRANNGDIDETADTSPFTETDTSETSPGKSLHRNKPNPKDSQIPGLGHVAVDGDESTRYLEVETSERTSSRQPSLLDSADAQESTAKKEAERLQKDTSSPALGLIPGLGLVAVHTNTLIASPLHDAMAEQAPAAESAMLALHSATSDREETPDPVLAQFMEDVEEMEAAVLADAEAQRKLLCRAHKMVALMHHNSWDPTWPVKERFCMNMKSRAMDRPQTTQEIQGFKNLRKRGALWQRHAVWERSPLCAETKLLPIQDRKGEHRVWHSFHAGKGPTDGDPGLQFWRRCNHCGESLRTLWGFDRRDRPGWN